MNGQNQHCQIVCNPLYTSYTTTAAKDRLTIIDVLRNGQPRRFRLNAEALGYLEQVQIAHASRQKVLHLPWEQDLDEVMLERLLTEHLPPVGAQQRKWIVDALAVAAYHAQTAGPVVRLLICGDAPQFTWATEALARCWVHEGRHSKKRTAWVAAHRTALDDCLEDFWDFSAEVLAYRDGPTAAERARLIAAFDTLVATKTDYWALNDRIAKTRAKKVALLMVLDHPEIALHTNPAALGARQRVRKRDVCFGPRTAEGAQAWDTGMTIVETAKSWA